MRPGALPLAPGWSRATRMVGAVGALWVGLGAVGAVGAVGGCGGSPSPAPLGPTEAPGYLRPEVVARAVDFSGSCAWGRSPGPPGRYRIRLRVRDNPSGTVEVRRTAVFDVTDRSNLLGELRSGTELWGDGPVHDHHTGRRGYAIVVRGHTGRVCRGYVSATSVRVR